MIVTIQKEAVQHKWGKLKALEEREWRMKSEMFEPRNYCLSRPSNRKKKIDYMQIFRSPSIIFFLGVIVGIAIMEVLK